MHVNEDIFLEGSDVQRMIDDVETKEKKKQDLLAKMKAVTVPAVVQCVL